MKKFKCAVVADIGLDVRRYGFSSRTSPEDPNCRVINDVGLKYELGLGGNLAAWLAARDELEVTLFGHCGEDDEGFKLNYLCHDNNIQLSPIFWKRGEQWATTRKERICISDEEGAKFQQLVRCDKDTNCNLTEEELGNFQEVFDVPEAFDLIVVADYGKSLFVGELGERLKNWLGIWSKLLVVNSKTPGKWQDITMAALVCNHQEAIRYLDLRQEAQADYLAITLGKGGAECLSDHGKAKVWAQSQFSGAPKDVTGCGDSFTAGFAFELLLSQQLGIPQSAWSGTALSALYRGQCWASHACGQIGCGTPISMNDGLQEIPRF